MKGHKGEKYVLQIEIEVFEFSKFEFKIKMNAGVNFINI